ncbi:MAG: ribose-phosphate pyrophosphokinae [Pseudobdellovibrio sp.]|nr:ribose-phosphate pyrophosphokinae [Pseudobdellovibrio sp.]
MSLSNLKIFAGNSTKELATQVTSLLGEPLGQSKVNSFADGETQVEIKESVRGKHVFIIQSTCTPVNQNYVELFIMLDALKRASSASVTAVIPYTLPRFRVSLTALLITYSRHLPWPAPSKKRLAKGPIS